MARLPERIDTEEQYHEMLGRLVNGAKMIDDPLTTEEERKRYMAGYDRMCALIDDYKEREWRELHARAARLYERQAIQGQAAR